MRPVPRLLPLCLAIAWSLPALAADPDPAPTWERCPTPGTIPEFRPPVTGAVDRVSAPTDVRARHLDVSEQSRTVLTGDVELERGDQWLGTDQLTVEHESEDFRTEGPVRYQDRGVRLTAARAEGDGATGDVRLDEVQYQLNDQLGNGSADRVSMQGDTGRLEGATFSTCPPGQRQWEFAASTIEVDQARGIGTARNATLRLGGVPVLWLPWVSFPTDDRRRTGLLSPRIGYDDRNGFDYAQPIYLNLAPNYDATLTPRWMAERGLMLGGEFRYLLPGHAGELEATWLPDDDLANRDRGLARWQHFSALGPNWHARADLNHVSDVYYFSDFGDSLANTSISLLGSVAGVYGRGRGWNASLSLQDWQIASPLVAPGTEPYQQLPALHFRLERPLQPWLEAGVRAEAIGFRHPDLPGGQRVDIQPWLRLPFGGASWYATPQLAWRYTGYSLDDALALPGGDTRPDRSLPIASFDAGAFFERQVDWGGGMLQTLEPRLFYLYVPYRDQDDLPLFDTQPLTFGWPGLFRSNRFSGGDRQGDANQVTLALTTRLLDGEDGRERLSASLGRIHFFETPRVTLPGAPALSDEGSAWVAEGRLALTERWSLGLAHQWDPEGERTALSAVRSQWRFDRGGLLNAAYRYRADQLEQTDLSFVLPLGRDWRLVGRWNYSLFDERTVEALGGIEWRSCCVALRLLGRRYVREFSGEQTSAIYVELELNGVGGFGRDTARLLDDAILGYSR